METWRQPAVPYVEIAYRRLKPLGAPRLTAYLAFTQLFLASLRNFLHLCLEHPRQDRSEEHMPAYTLASIVSYLNKLAFTLCFNKKTIKKNIRQNIKEHFLNKFRLEPSLLAN